MDASSWHCLSSGWLKRQWWQYLLKILPITSVPSMFLCFLSSRSISEPFFMMPRSAVEARRLLINLSQASSRTLEVRSIAATTRTLRSRSFSSSTFSFYPSVATSSGQGRRHPYYDAMPSARLSRDPKAPGSRPAGPPPPPNETPAQKVARLRAQRERELMENIPLWDLVVVQGRIWADRVHTITLFGLLLSACKVIPGLLGPFLPIR